MLGTVKTMVLRKGSDDGKNSGNIAVEVPQEMETKGGT